MRKLFITGMMMSIMLGASLSAQKYNGMINIVRCDDCGDVYCADLPSGHECNDDSESDEDSE